MTTGMPFPRQTALFSLVLVVLASILDGGSLILLGWPPGKLVGCEDGNIKRLGRHLGGQLNGAATGSSATGGDFCQVLDMLFVFALEGAVVLVLVKGEVCPAQRRLDVGLRAVGRPLAD